MYKTTLRPLRLVHLNKYLSHKLASMVEESNESEVQDEDEAAMPHNTLPSFPDQSFQGDFPAWSTIQEDNNCMATSITDRTNKDHIPASEVEAQHLLQRTPNSYMLNQAYGMWFFISWFFLTVIITRKVSTNDYGTFAIALAAFNTVAYIVALGLVEGQALFHQRLGARVVAAFADDVSQHCERFSSVHAIARCPGESDALVEKWVRCAACGSGLAPENARVAIDGAHEHDFMNPAGIRFRVACSPPPAPQNTPRTLP